MGKSTISMAIFNSKLLVYQAGYHLCSHSTPLSEPMAANIGRVPRKCQIHNNRCLSDNRAMAGYPKHWLVVLSKTPLKNDGVKVSWDYYSIPN